MIMINSVIDKIALYYLSYSIPIFRWHDKNIWLRWLNKIVHFIFRKELYFRNWHRQKMWVECVDGERCNSWKCGDINNTQGPNLNQITCIEVVIIQWNIHWSKHWVPEKQSYSSYPKRIPNDRSQLQKCFLHTVIMLDWSRMT